MTLFDIFPPLLRDQISLNGWPVPPVPRPSSKINTPCQFSPRNFIIVAERRAACSRFEDNRSDLRYFSAVERGNCGSTPAGGSSDRKMRGCGARRYCLRQVQSDIGGHAWFEGMVRIGNAQANGIDGVLASLHGADIARGKFSLVGNVGHLSHKDSAGK